jgi:uncharacterized protein (DUF427 family)
MSDRPIRIPGPDHPITITPTDGHEASYYSLPTGERPVNAVWSYREPHEAVAAIRGHVAFYPDRVDSIEILPA